MPYVEGALENVKQLKTKFNADIIIISDANTIYIDESLANAGIKDHITEIYTNPAEFSTDGRLKVHPFTQQTDCNLSNRNMCKGKIMLDYAKNRNYSFTVYVGDGQNDFCPMLKLGENDLAFVRKGFALQRHIEKMKLEGCEIKAKITYWETGTEIHEEICRKIEALKKS